MYLVLVPCTMYVAALSTESLFTLNTYVRSCTISYSCIPCTSVHTLPCTHVNIVRVELELLCTSMYLYTILVHRTSYSYIIQRNTCNVILCTLYLVRVLCSTLCGLVDETACVCIAGTLYIVQGIYDVHMYKVQVHSTYSTCT